MLSDGQKLSLLHQGGNVAAESAAEGGTMIT